MKSLNSSEADASRRLKRERLVFIPIIALPSFETPFISYMSTALSGARKNCAPLTRQIAVMTHFDSEPSSVL